MGNSERLAALWRTKSRATQRLIEAHRDEYNKYRDEELIKEGQAPVGEYTREVRTLDQVIGLPQQREDVAG